MNGGSGQGGQLKSTGPAKAPGDTGVSIDGDWDGDRKWKELCSQSRLVSTTEDIDLCPEVEIPQMRCMEQGDMEMPKEMVTLREAAAVTEWGEASGATKYEGSRRKGKQATEFQRGSGGRAPPGHGPKAGRRN